MSFLVRAAGACLVGSTCVVGALASCSSEKPAASGSTSGIGVPDSSASDSPIGDKDTGIDSTSPTSPKPLGDLPTVDEADIPCVKAGGAKVKLFGAGTSGSGAPAVRNLQAFQTNRLGSGPLIEGFVVFGPDGATPQEVPIALGGKQSIFMSEGDTAGAMLLTGATVEYQRYNNLGVAQGSRVVLASGISPPANAEWMGTGAGGSLAVWFTGTTLQAAGVTTAGAAAGPAWTLATGVTGPIAVSMTYANGKYAIAYSYSVGAKTDARFQLADATGPSGAAVPLANGTDGIVVSAITSTSTGYILLFDGGADDLVYVVPLDATGKVSGVARRLLGGDAPWAVASRGSDVALVTMSNDTKVSGKEGPRKPQFRSLDTTGKPLAPWVCFDDRVPAGQYQDMGVLAETTGYAVVFKTVQDELALQRVDKLGTGAPTP